MCKVDNFTDPFIAGVILVNLIPYKVGGCLSKNEGTRHNNGRVEISLGRHFEFLTFDDIGAGSEAFAITKSVYVSNTTPVYGR